MRASPKVIAEQFELFESPDFEARYNIAPSQPVAAVRMQAEARPPRRELVFFRWGLIPSWANDPAIGKRLINARAETAAERPAFRQAFARRRCLIVADGFYEWQKKRGRLRQPYWIRMRDDRPFAFAGLWESWEGADHSSVQSCTVLTTEANELMRPLHDRMPVIVETTDYGRWLDPALHTSADLSPLLRPFPSAPLEAIPVSRRVNSPAREGPGCIAPREEQRGLDFND